MGNKKKRMEYRYYDMPTGSYILPMLGKGWEQEYGVEYPDDFLHFHNYMEIGYCYNGDGNLVIEDRSYEYKGEMFSIIPANIPHTTNSKPGNICKWEFLFIDIESFIANEINVDDFQKRQMISIINKRGTLKTDRNHTVMSKLILNIIRECRDQNTYYEDSIKGYLYALVIEMIRLADERDRTRNAKRVSEYIKKSLDYINEHYKEEIRMENIAEASGLSESHFRRVFEDAMNMKPLDYVNLVRVDKACVMMGKEDISMEEISYRVGFQTQSTFNRNFKRLTGMSPHQWKTKEKSQEGILKNYQISAMKGWEA